MAIEIATTFLAREDAVSNDPDKGAMLFNAPYIVIDQHGYGRMDVSTPAQGLSTCGVASCLAIVLHSPTTERTVLTHSPNFLQMKTFVPIVDWVTGGNGDVSHDEIQAWLRGAGAEPHVMEVVVLRGFLYATPSLAAEYGHDEWMSDFRQFMSLFAPIRAIQLNIVDAPRLLLNGAVLVDKTTGRITCLELHKSTFPRNFQVWLQNPSIPRAESYSTAQGSQDLFVGMLLGTMNPPQTAPISLQYNVSRYCLPLPLTDEGRQLLRSRKEGEAAGRQSAIIRAIGESQDWISNSQDHMAINASFKTLLDAGLPCERCNKPGWRKCSRCKGAWYCGEEHQRVDWKAHKGWCQSHPFTR